MLDERVWTSHTAWTVRYHVFEGHVITLRKYTVDTADGYGADKEAYGMLQGDTDNLNPLMGSNGSLASFMHSVNELTTI